MSAESARELLDDSQPRSCWERCCARSTGIFRSGVELVHWGGPLQARIHPTKWALTYAQMKAFVEECKNTEKYTELLDSKGFVNLYDMNTHFVMPKTRGTGRSIALMYNEESPVTAECMISHAWGEDVDELMNALELSGIFDTTPVFFCLLSIYQTGGEEGDVGPTIPEQLGKRPFQEVIHHIKTGVNAATFTPTSMNQLKMIVVHTTQAELYERLWCVHEIDEALEADIDVQGVCSLQYALNSVDKFGKQGFLDQSKIAIDTSKAGCGCPADEQMLRKLIEERDGGYARLDSTVLAFRKKMISKVILRGQTLRAEFPEFAEPAKRGFLKKIGSGAVAKAVKAMKRMRSESDI